jgi:hypothetical protein
LNPIANARHLGAKVDLHDDGCGPTQSLIYTKQQICERYDALGWAQIIKGAEKAKSQPVTGSFSSRFVVSRARSRLERSNKVIGVYLESTISIANSTDDPQDTVSEELLVSIFSEGGARFGTLRKSLS